MHTARPLVTGAWLLVLGVLVLQALGYGIGFFSDPAAGLGEFASPPPAGEDALTVALVGMIGAGMLGVAAVLGAAAILVLRGNPAGAYLAIAVGVIYVLVGLSAARSGWAWDAYFYAGTGALTVLLSAVVLRLRRPRGHA